MKSIIFIIIFLATSLLCANVKKFELIFDVNQLPLYILGGPSIEELSFHEGVLYNYFRPAVGDNYIYKTKISNINWTIFGRDTSIYKLADRGDGTFGRIYSKKKLAYWAGAFIFDQPLTYVTASSDLFYYFDGISIDPIVDSIPINNGDVSYAYNSIKSIDNHSAVVAGNKVVFITKDTGKSWQDISPDPIQFNFKGAVYLTLSNLNIIDKSNFFLTMRYDSNQYTAFESNRHYSILKTNNAGKSWENVITLDSLNNGYVMSDICFIDTNTGWWLGKRYPKPVESISTIILHTTDGGKNWETQLDIKLTKSIGVGSIDFYDRNFGVAYLFGDLLYTYDGGKKWNYLNFKDYDTSYIRVNAFSFIDNKSFVIGTNTTGKVFKVTLDPTTSVDGFKIPQSNIFPNPANEYLNISFESTKEGIGKIEIIDLLGKTVCSFENYIIEGNNSIKYSELSTLPTATYTIKVTMNNEIVSIGKFIKQ